MHLIFYNVLSILSLMLTALSVRIWNIQIYHSCQETIFNVFKRLFLVEYGVVPVGIFFQNSN